MALYGIHRCKLGKASKRTKAIHFPVKFLLGVIVVFDLGLIWNSWHITSQNVLRRKEVQYDSSTVNTRVAINIHSQLDVGVPIADSHHLWKLLDSCTSEFCKTPSPGHYYHFNFIFTQCGKSKSKNNVQGELRKKFEQLVQVHCTPTSEKNVQFVFLTVRYPPDKLAWALGEIIWDQYVLGFEYFYFGSPELLFTRLDVQQLHKNLLGKQPSNLGTLFRNDGKELCFHATHLEIFGRAFPRMFPKDDAYLWLAKVYQNESLCRGSLRLSDNCTVNDKRLRDQLEEDRNTLRRYKLYRSKTTKEETFQERRVISMSLYGSDKRYPNNAIRNALLAKVHYPSWTLRLYIEKPDKSGKTKYQQPPEYVLKKLAGLGAEFKVVNLTKTDLPPMFWRFMVADDTQVDIFIVRDCDSLLSARDATVVEKWLRTGKAFHCVRDHPSHGHYALSGGLWGARRAELAEHLGKSFEEMMVGKYNDKYLQDMKFLRAILWPKVQNNSFCHDSVSCDRWPGSYPFPVARIGQEHVGSVFDAFGDNRQNDLDILKNTPINERCSPGNTKTV